MARTKRRIRDRGRKSQKRKKPIRTRRRRRGSVKRRRTKSRQVLKGGSCCGSRPVKDRRQFVCDHRSFGTNNICGQRFSSAKGLRTHKCLAHHIGC